MTLPARLFPKPPAQVAPYVDIPGPENTKALAKADHFLQRRVPLANPWVAACLHVQGLATNEIASKLRVTDVTVRKYLQSCQVSRETP